MDKKEELKGILKELITDEIGSDIDALKEKAAVAEEANTKLLEANTELKTQFDATQEKTFKLQQNTGDNTYVFKGYNTSDITKNFKVACSKEVGDKVVETITKALTSANTGAYAIPTEYSSALLGLAELQSYALSHCRVIRYPGEVLKMPMKATRATVDAQAFGTANTAAGTTLGQLVFTIDKRVGGYETIYSNVLRQSNFDVVGEIVEPMMAEAIGQNFDNEMFEKTEFTSDITSGGTTAATFSGTIGSTSITYSGLMDVEFEVEQERGVNPEWCMPRGVFKQVAKLRDDNNNPIFNRDLTGSTPFMIDGYPVNIVPAISATPADGSIALAFGDPKQYIIAINQDTIFEINPYAGMKEGTVQFIMHCTGDGNITSANTWATYGRSD